MSNLSSVIKSIQDVMRQDSGVDGDAQRLSQLCWLFFLKIIDDQDKELEVTHTGYRSPIPDKLQWRNWAADPEGVTGEALTAFINGELFPALKGLQLTGKPGDRRRVVRDVFEDAYNYMKSGQLMRQVVNKIAHLHKDRTQIDIAQELIAKYEYTKLEILVKEEIFDYCECGNVMEVMPSSSEMVCDNCGFVTKLIGTVFEDNQFYNQEGGRYRHAGYEPSKHCKCWLERIQAKETNTITQVQIEKLEACIRRDRITNKRRITIGQLRNYLKDAGLTELNEHVALIKKIITGVVPPQLSFAETQDITNSFSKAVKAYNVVRPSNKSNNIYYPYILRKLIEMHINDYNKQKELLSFIHLQGSQTLIQNDKIWRDICNITPSFIYQPTDRYAFVD